MSPGITKWRPGWHSHPQLGPRALQEPTCLHSPAQVRRTGASAVGWPHGARLPAGPGPSVRTERQPERSTPGLPGKPKAPLCPRTSQLWSPGHMMEEPNPFRETNFSNLFRQLPPPSLHTGEPALLHSGRGGDALSLGHCSPSPTPSPPCHRTDVAPHPVTPTLLGVKCSEWQREGCWRSCSS